MSANSAPENAGDRWIDVPKWDDFQHYKNRGPSWIKNYTRLLHDDAYLNLTYAQRGLLHGIWLLRASANEAPTSTRTKHLLTTNKAEARHFQDNLEALNQAGFITLSASKPLAQRYQPASPEKEKEKKEQRAPAQQPKPQPLERPHICHHQDCQVAFKYPVQLKDHLYNIHHEGD